MGGVAEGESGLPDNVGLGCTACWGVAILLGICRLVTVYRLWGEEVVGVVSSILVEVVGWYHRVHMGSRSARSRGKGGEGNWKLFRVRWYQFHS